MCFVWLIINKAFVRVELYTLILIHYVLENEYYTRIGVFFPWIDRRCMIHEELCRALQLIFDQFDSSPIHTFSNTYWSTNDNIKITRMYQTDKWLLLSHMSLISYPPPRWTIVTSVGFKSALSIPDFVQHLVILIIIIISFFSHAANLSSVRTPSSKTQALI